MGALIRFYEGRRPVVDMLSNDDKGDKKQRRRPDIALGDGVSLQRILTCQKNLIALAFILNQKIPRKMQRIREGRKFKS